MCQGMTDTQLSGHAQISVGRLGIITELDFIITPQALITRTQQQLSWAQFVAWIGFTQDAYRAALASGSQAAISAALAPLDMAQVQRCLS